MYYKVFQVNFNFLLKLSVLFIKVVPTNLSFTKVIPCRFFFKSFLFLRYLQQSKQKLKSRTVGSHSSHNRLEETQIVKYALAAVGLNIHTRGNALTVRRPCWHCIDINVCKNIGVNHNAVKLYLCDQCSKRLQRDVTSEQKGLLATPPATPWMWAKPQSTSQSYPLPKYNGHDSHTDCCVETLSDCQGEWLAWVDAS